MNPIFETVKQLSVTEQIDLLHYLAKQVNQQVKLVHVAFLPREETPPVEIDNPILTNDEFEILLEWLTHLRQQEKSRLGLSNQKRLKLMEWVTDSFMQDVPQWGGGAEFWPEDDIEIFDQFLQAPMTNGTVIQNAPQRPFGLCQGQFVVSTDFDAPLPDEILRDFEGELFGKK